MAKFKPLLKIQRLPDVQPSGNRCLLLLPLVVHAFSVLLSQHGYADYGETMAPIPNAQRGYRCMSLHWQRCLARCVCVKVHFTLSCCRVVKFPPRCLMCEACTVVNKMRGNLRAGVRAG